MKLYIVGTPIGNLGDITLRAIDTLKSVDIIACEDTRHSLPLLKHLGVSKELLSYHQHNETACANKIISLIESGKTVALITDAGMPSISDPGATLVSSCHEHGIKVEVVPGPTAVASAIALSGITSKGFCFLGFLPEKRVDRDKIIDKVAFSDIPLVFYVAPHDIEKTCDYLLSKLGDQKIWIARELTKMFETLHISTLQCLECEKRGEMVLIVENLSKDSDLLSLDIKEHILHYLDKGIDKKTAVKQVASERNLTKNEVYQIAIDIE